MDRLLKVFYNLGIPIRYIGNDEGLAVPFGIYKRENKSGVYADDKPHFNIINVSLELYFNRLEHQLIIEQKLEEMLSSEFGITYSSSEDIILEDKKTILKIYNMEVLENDSRSS